MRIPGDISEANLFPVGSLNKLYALQTLYMGIKTLGHTPKIADPQSRTPQIIILDQIHILQRNMNLRTGILKVAVKVVYPRWKGKRKKEAVRCLEEGIQHLSEVRIFGDEHFESVMSCCITSGSNCLIMSKEIKFKEGIASSSDQQMLLLLQIMLKK